VFWPSGIGNLTVHWIVVVLRKVSSLQKVVKQAWVSSHKWIFPHTLRISWLMWVKFDMEHLHAMSLSRCEFVKICAFESVLYFRAWMKFCLHFLHFLFDEDRVLCRSWLTDCEFLENRHVPHLFRYSKIRHKGSKRNSVGGFMNPMKIAVHTGINEVTFMGVVWECVYCVSLLHCRKRETWGFKDKLGLLPKFLNFWDK